jgi:DNA-binding winged helix-turn-helix (wHTH) protein
MDRLRKDAILRFGNFEFDHSSGELRKGGIRIHLQGQPVAILGILLGKAGELVEREELRAHLWRAIRSSTLSED